MKARLSIARNLAWLYGTALALWLPLLGLLRLRQIDYLQRAQAGTDEAALPDLTRALANLDALLNGLLAYFGALPLALGALLVLLALWTRPRPGLTLLLAGLIPALGIALGGGGFLSLRYHLFAIPPLLVLVGGGLAALARRSRVMATGLLALWLVGNALPFLWTAWHAPESLPLPRSDWLEYIAADSAGIMIPELAAWLATEAQERGPLTVTGVISQCQTLARYLAQEAEGNAVTLECPRLMSPQGRGEALDTQILARMQAGGRLLILHERAGLVPRADIHSVTLAPLAEFPRPGGLVTITVYRAQVALSPSP